MITIGLISGSVLEVVKGKQTLYFLPFWIKTIFWDSNYKEAYVQPLVIFQGGGGGGGDWTDPLFPPPPLDLPMSLLTG